MWMSIAEFETAALFENEYNVVAFPDGTSRFSSSSQLVTTCCSCSTQPLLVVGIRQCLKTDILRKSKWTAGSDETSQSYVGYPGLGRAPSVMRADGQSDVNRSVHRYLDRRGPVGVLRINDRFPLYAVAGMLWSESVALADEPHPVGKHDAVVV